MAPKHAAIGVQLVDHDVAQVFKRAGPFGVVRQDSGVQHVRIGQDHVPALANCFARVAGRIAVVGKNSEAVVEPRRQIVQLC